MSHIFSTANVGCEWRSNWTTSKKQFPVRGTNCEDMLLFLKQWNAASYKNIPKMFTRMNKLCGKVFQSATPHYSHKCVKHCHEIDFSCDLNPRMIMGIICRVAVQTTKLWKNENYDEFILNMKVHKNILEIKMAKQWKGIYVDFSHGMVPFFPNKSRQQMKSNFIKQCQRMGHTS